MTELWANSGLDLHLPPAGPGRRARLEEALRDAVISGRLRPGTRLPSSRTLATDLGLARNTVAEAYAQLVAEGWLVSRQGSGTRVAEAVNADPQPLPRTSPATPPVRYDLRPGRPELASFPRAAWVAALRRGLSDAPHARLGYGDPRGTPELRRALAGYLARVRGVRARPDNVVVCGGITQALALFAESVARPGEVIGVEEAGLPHHRTLLARHGLSTIALPVDDEGADVRRLPGQARAVLLTPAHQFPLGVALAPGRRTDVVVWARAAGGLVVEDDYDGEFRYDRQPVGAVQALNPDVVVYCGTASKSLAPGVRLGWMVLPDPLVEPVAEAKRLTDHQASALDQLAFADLVSSGRFDRHVRRARLAYRRRRDLLVSALTERAPLARVSGIAAGHHLVVELPRADGSAGETEQAVVTAARRRGLALEGLSTYLHPDAAPRDPALVVGYGTPAEHEFAGAVEVLCRQLGHPEARGGGAQPAW